MEIQSNYFKRHLVCLTLGGVAIQPFENDLLRTLYPLYSAVCMFLFVLCYNIAEILDLALSDISVDDMSFNLCYLVCHLIGAAKILKFFTEKKKIWKTLQTLESGLMKPNFERGGNAEFEEVKSAIKLSNVQGAAFQVFAVATIVTRGIYCWNDDSKYEEVFNAYTNTTVVRRVRPVPSNTWMPFDRDIQPNYTYVFSYNILSMVYNTLLIFSSDVIICGLMVQMKCQFKILQSSLSTFVTRAKQLNGYCSKQTDILNNLELLPNSQQINCRNFLKDNIRHHQIILDTCKDIESTFYFVMFLQFLGSMLVICFVLFQLTLTNLGGFRFLSLITYMALMMGQLFLYCLVGNQVLLDSESLSDCIWESDWLVLDKDLKKSLIIMMHRCQKPVIFTAGKFVNLSLATFVAILKTSGSYFMVLREVNNPK